MMLPELGNVTFEDVDFWLNEHSSLAIYDQERLGKSARGFFSGIRASGLLGTHSGGVPMFDAAEFLDQLLEEHDVQLESERVGRNVGMTSYYPSHPSQSPPSTPTDLPVSLLSTLFRPENYIADDGLVDAVNVALMLRQPLMVTGEPGTGKTMLASSIAWELGLDRPLVFETKSTSTARDLFYTYDTLGRFTAKELSTKAGAPQDYVTFNALGEAIIRSSDPADLEEILPSAYSHPGPRRSVVLIDEVEKAPRDFPNDILNEIERLYFRIPELGNRRIDANPGYDPVVVMTNNSEKSLPDAFLRRYIFFNIPFPSGERANGNCTSASARRFR